jgi:uncharacterized protein YkwD
VNYLCCKNFLPDPSTIPEVSSYIFRQSERDIMRYVFCLLLLVWSCDKGSSGSTPGIQTEAGVPAKSETPVIDGPADDTVIDVPLDPKEEMTEEFMTLINDHRVSLGLRPLQHETGLQEIAEGHSENMAGGKVAFGHTGFSDRCALGRKVLGSANLCAENVAYGQKTVQAAFNSWMNSSGHRANIELSRVTHTGFGFAKSSSGVWYWTQIFLEKN